VGMRDEVAICSDGRMWLELRRATPAGHGGGVRRDPEPPAEPVITQNEATDLPAWLPFTTIKAGRWTPFGHSSTALV